MKEKPSIKDLAERIAEQIIDHARRASLAKGTRLPAQSLADIFSVSRTPVVEALNYLEKFGVVRHLPRRGYVLATDGAELSNLGTGKQGRESDLVYELFTESHLRNELPSRFTESSLRRRLNITQNQLNNLLTRLEREGLVESSPGYGWVLNEVLSSGESIEKSYRFRIIIEPAAILEASFVPVPGELSKLRSINLSMLEGGAARMTPDQIFDANVDFHQTIISWANNPFLLDALKKQNALRRLMVRNVGDPPERQKRILQEHLALLSALEKKQFVEASLLMNKHLAANARTIGDAFFCQQQSFSKGLCRELDVRQR